MSISHEQARQLIQFKSDQGLTLEKQKTLASHLQECQECLTYANEIHETEGILRSVMQKQWNLRPLPLHASSIRAKASSNGNILTLVPTRSVLIGMTVMLFIFLAWQFTAPTDRASTPLIFDLSPIPTPSTSITSTKTEIGNCSKIQYLIQNGDTLEKVARQFSTSREALMELNPLISDDLSQINELTVPVCDLTPTSTLSPTFTITPTFEMVVYTPG